MLWEDISFWNQWKFNTMKISSRNSSKLSCGYQQIDSKAYMEKQNTQKSQYNSKREKSWRTSPREDENSGLFTALKHSFLFISEPKDSVCVCVCVHACTRACAGRWERQRNRETKRKGLPMQHIREILIPPFMNHLWKLKELPGLPKSSPLFVLNLYCPIW